MFIISWIAIPVIVMALILANLFLMKSKPLKSKMSIYECGFSPKFSARLPFSLRFFLLALLFLIFDVELVIVIIFPMILAFSASFFSVVIFCLFLFFGLFHEWNEGSLSWIK